MALVLATSEVAAGHVSFTPSVVVRAASFEPGSPDLSAYGTRAVAGWAEPIYAPNSVWVARSTNGGSTFGPPLRLAKSLAQSAQSIAVFSGPADHLAVWSETISSGGSRIFLSRTGSWTGAWSAPTQVSANTGASTAFSPRIVRSGNILILTYLASPAGSSVPTAHVRTKIGLGAWSAPLVLPGGSTGGPVSMAVSATRLLLAWQTSGGQIRLKRANIGGGGATITWVTGTSLLGTGFPFVVMSGTRAVLLWHQNADVFRRLSTNSGDSWGPTVKILDGLPTQPDDTGNPYSIDDVAMAGSRVAFTATDTESPEIGGDGWRVTSANYGATWTAEVASQEAGDMRQVAFATVAGASKLVESWLRTQGQAYPWVLRAHRQQ